MKLAVFDTYRSGGLPNKFSLALYYPENLKLMGKKKKIDNSDIG